MDTGGPAASQLRLARPPTDAQTTTPKYSHIPSPSERPSLLRLPSTSSAATSKHSRRASNPARTPTTQTPSASPATTTTPSYFSSQPASTGKDGRSPGTRRPPASFSSFGKAYGDTSRGPPISVSGTWPKQDTSPLTLQTSTERMAGSSEAWPGYEPAARPRILKRHITDSRYGDTDTSGVEGDGGEDLFLNIAEDSANDSPNPVSRTDRVRSRIARANRQSLPASMPSSSTTTPYPTRPNGTRIPAAIDTKASTQYRRSSLLPSSTRTTREQSPLTPANPGTIPAYDASPRTRRSVSSLFRGDKEHESQEYIAPQPETSRLPKASSFSPKEFLAQVEAVKARQKDTTLSPKEFLAQLDAGKRRPSYPDALHTPPNRNGAYKPSNLHYYSSSRDNLTTSHIDTPSEARSRYESTTPQEARSKYEGTTPQEARSRYEGTTPQEARSRYEGTESHDSTGAATSMWDELDELKTRMKRLEMGGKLPATSSAAVAQASAAAASTSADRPQTANTPATTVSSSPNQQRKQPSSDSTVPAPASTPSKVHPLLHEALARVKPHIAPAVYRALEAVASEALALAEMSGSGGPQGTFHSTNSILGGASLSERQVRRKADHICRNLTDLCIVLQDHKPTMISPAVQRSSAATISRRPSLQINGESPTIRQSVEPESNAFPRSSPSRAMSRIEARRSNMLTRRETSLEPPTPSQSQSQAPSRLDRASTSLNRRPTAPAAELEDDDPTLRAPSRAFTDFRETRFAPKSRFAREYISREPMPDLQPSPALQTPARRTTLTGSANESNLLYQGKESAIPRRFGVNAQSGPAYDKPLEGAAKASFIANRTSIGGSFPLGRSSSLKRRRGVAGE